MKIKLWGVRGSLPSPMTPAQVERRVASAIRQFLEKGNETVSDIAPFLSTLPPGELGGFGGNTPCVQVCAGESMIILDGGTGIRGLGEELMKGPCGKGQGKVHILMTHFHWDHLMGIPFFMPLYVAGNEVHFHAVQDELKDVVSLLFRRPHFPVEVARLQASISYHKLEPRTAVDFGGIQVTPYQLDHPDPCWGFKCESGGKVFSHCVDSETRRFSREELGPDLPLYQGVDLLLFDGQYSLMESILKENWGHGTAMVGIDLAIREGVRKILIMHHDPSSADETVRTVEVDTQKYFESQLKQARRNDVSLHYIEWGFAREGMEVEL